MVVLLLTGAADGQYLVEVTANVVQQSGSEIDLSLEEAEQRVLDVLLRPLQLLDALNPNN